MNINIKKNKRKNKNDNNDKKLKINEDNTKCKVFNSKNIMNILYK